MLKYTKLRASDYLAVAAFQIASRTEPGNYQNAVNRTRDFYDSMKSRNFFITGHDDYIFAAMLGLSDLDVASGTERIAEIIGILKKKFRHKNSIQTLSQILALNESCDETVERVIKMNTALRLNRIRLDKMYTLPTLGILALLPVETDVIVRDIAETERIIRGQHGFSIWSVSKQELLIYAAATTVGEYTQGSGDGVVTAAVSTSITNLIIAQQVAMIAAVSASTATAASSSG